MCFNTFKNLKQLFLIGKSLYTCRLCLCCSNEPDDVYPFESQSSSMVYEESNYMKGVQKFRENVYYEKLCMGFKIILHQKINT